MRRATIVLLLTVSPALAAQERATDGLTALFTFNSTGTNIVDVVGDPAVEITIGNGNGASIQDGVLVIKDKPSIVAKDSSGLVRSIKRGNALTVEVWCRPDNTSQKGPARIVTISRDSVNRNLTVGQDGKRFDVRLRSKRTSANGLPSLTSDKAVAITDVTHLVYTAAPDGTSTLYINGQPVASKKLAGDLSNWDDGYKLAFGDEISGGRVWKGDLHLVAFYDRPLSGVEVKSNFEVGPMGELPAEMLAARKQQKAARHFETTVAPIIAKHCIECHDSASNKGGLNLSLKQTAFAASDSGQTIQPGSAAKSYLWEAVETDAMPHDRPALPPADKAALKQWIDDGAVWSLDEIDPAIYVHGMTEQYVQRLTVDEYIETVRVLTGVDIADDARDLLPADLRADGFSNTSYNLGVDLKHIAAYSQLAENVVSQMDVLSFVRRFSKQKKFTDRAMEDVIERMGEVVLRGPVSNREVIAFRGITTSVAAAGGSFEEAMALLLEAMFQSPRFLYRMEVQPSAGQVQRVSPYELASRLSYIVWGGPPDSDLLQDAAAGDLSERVALHCERMMKDERARAQSQWFADDWLNLSRLANLQPNQQRFPEWRPELASDMRAETLAFFDEVVWQQQRPLSDLLNARLTFVTPELAEFYGLDVSGVEATAGQPLVRLELPEDSVRGGLLTQGSLLTIGGDDASMVTRGLLVLHELLRGVVNDPPPCVDTSPVPTKSGLTQRDIALQRINNNACGGCHSRFEPLAFGLEKFDGVGRYHDKDEHGNALRDDGEILFPGSAQPMRYESSRDLMKALAESDRVQLSFTWKVTQFALGRPLVAADASAVQTIHRDAMQNGGTWKALLTAICTSDLVLKSRGR